MLNWDDNFMDKFPLINQNIAETISSILLTKNESKLNNINNILDENLNNTNMNNNTKRNLENYFKGITIELRDIMVEPSSKYIKKDYIIPFKYINDKNIFEYQEKMSYRLDDDKSIKLLMMNNLNLLYSTMKSDGTFKIELKDTKIILCCFLFFTINLFYDVYKYYINSLKINRKIKYIAFYFFVCQRVFRIGSFEKIHFRTAAKLINRLVKKWPVAIKSLQN
jgi:hypothetical protein